MTDQTIKITQRAFDEIKRTVGLHEPETLALLGGRPSEDPNLITEVRFCPALEASSSHVVPNADLANFTILEEWQPQGLYTIGAVHSHPGTVGTPSQGDMVVFRAWLESDDAVDVGWTRFLAPIVTFPDRGEMQIAWWFFDRGDSQPRRAYGEVIPDHPNPSEYDQAPEPIDHSAGLHSIAEQCVAFSQEAQRISRRRDLGLLGKWMALRDFYELRRAWRDQMMARKDFWEDDQYR